MIPSSGWRLTRARINSEEKLIKGVGGCYLNIPRSASFSQYGTCMLCASFPLRLWGTGWKRYFEASTEISLSSAHLTNPHRAVVRRSCRHRFAPQTFWMSLILTPPPPKVHTVCLPPPSPRIKSGAYPSLSSSNPPRSLCVLTHSSLANPSLLLFFRPSASLHQSHAKSHFDASDDEEEPAKKSLIMPCLHLFVSSQ